DAAGSFFENARTGGVYCFRDEFIQRGRPVFVGIEFGLHWAKKHVRRVFCCSVLFVSIDPTIGGERQLAGVPCEFVYGPDDVWRRLRDDSSFFSRYLWA